MRNMILLKQQIVFSVRSNGGAEASSSPAIAVTAQHPTLPVSKATRLACCSEQRQGLGWRQVAALQQRLAGSVRRTRDSARKKVEPCRKQQAWLHL